MISETIHRIAMKFSRVIVGTSGKVCTCVLGTGGVSGYRGAIFRVFDYEFKVYWDGSTRKKRNISGATRRGVTGAGGE